MSSHWHETDGAQLEQELQSNEENTMGGEENATVSFVTSPVASGRRGIDTSTFPILNSDIEAEKHLSGCS